MIANVLDIYQTGTLQEPPGKLAKLPMVRKSTLMEYLKKGFPDNLVNSHTPDATMRPIMTTRRPKLRSVSIMGSVSIRHHSSWFFQSLQECFQEPSMTRMFYRTIQKTFHGDLANHETLQETPGIGVVSSTPGCRKWFPVWFNESVYVLSCQISKLTAA